MTTQNKIRLSLIFAALIVVSLVAVLLNNRPDIQAGGADGVLGGNFTLNGVDGDVSLSDFQDQVVVLYFGFVSCSEVCPTSMGVLQQAMERLSPEELRQVQSLLVSIDPKRDTPHALQMFTEQYHQNILGLMGTQSQIDAVTANYGAHFEITDADRADQDYAFRHSSRYYVIDQQGNLIDAMRHSTTPTELVARIRTLL